jgi:hypothetical protein
MMMMLGFAGPGYAGYRKAKGGRMALSPDHHRISTFGETAARRSFFLRQRAAPAAQDWNANGRFFFGNWFTAFTAICSSFVSMVSWSSLWVEGRNSRWMEPMSPKNNSTTADRFPM